MSSQFTVHSSQQIQHTGLSVPLKFLALVCCCVCLMCSDALAMHITEGIIPYKGALLWGVLSLPFIATGLVHIKKLKAASPLYFSMVGLIGASVFVLSAFPIPVPFAGTCSHAAGTGLSAIFLGFFPSVVVAFISLIIQALFMAHGGLTSLGANLMTMGVCGSLCGWIAFKGCKKAGLSLFWSGFAAGFAADIATYASTALILAVSIAPDHLTAFKEISLAFVPTQVPLGILEGAITGYAVRYVHQHKPELFLPGFGADAEKASQ